MRRAALLLAVVVLAGCGGGSRRALVYATADDPEIFRMHPIAAGYSQPVSHVWRADPDGGNRRVLTTGDSPLLSPDGRWIAYEAAPGQVALIGSGGGKARVVFRGRWALPVAWARDGAWFLVADERGLHRVERASGQQRLVVGVVARTEAIESPTIAPDGRAIVYALAGHTGSDLYRVSAHGGRPRRLTHDDRSLSPLYGPDGRIVFARTNRQRWDLWRINPDGTGLTRITRVRTTIVPVAWSADGRRLLAATPAMHNGRLWAVSLPSRRTRALTPLVGDLFAQGLSRDGKTVLAAIGCGGLVSRHGVVETLPFDGRGPKTIVDGPCRASWNA